MGSAVLTMLEKATVPALEAAWAPADGQLSMQGTLPGTTGD